MGLLFLPAIAGMGAGASLLVFTSFVQIVLQKYKLSHLHWMFHLLAALTIVYGVLGSEELQRAGFFISSYVIGACLTYAVLFALLRYSLSEDGKAKPRNLLIWMISIGLGLAGTSLLWGILVSFEFTDISVKRIFLATPIIISGGLLIYSAVAINKNRKVGLYTLLGFCVMSLFQSIYFVLTYESKWFDPVQYLMSVAIFSLLPLFVITYLFSRIEHMD